MTFLRDRRNLEEITLLSCFDHPAQKITDRIGIDQRLRRRGCDVTRQTLLQSALCTGSEMKEAFVLAAPSVGRVPSSAAIKQGDRPLVGAVSARDALEIVCTAYASARIPHRRPAVATARAQAQRPEPNT
jgi:hypothetical protein